MRKLRWPNLVNARYFKLDGYKAQSLCEIALFKYVRLQRPCTRECAVLQPIRQFSLGEREKIICLSHTL
jgi:hypothetical protein